MTEEQRLHALDAMETGKDMFPDTVDVFNCAIEALQALEIEYNQDYRILMRVPVGEFEYLLGKLEREDREQYYTWECRADTPKAYYTGHEFHDYLLAVADLGKRVEGSARAENNRNNRVKAFEQKMSLLEHNKTNAAAGEKLAISLPGGDIDMMAAVAVAEQTLTDYGYPEKAAEMRNAVYADIKYADTFTAFDTLQQYVDVVIQSGNLQLSKRKGGGAR